MMKRLLNCMLLMGLFGCGQLCAQQARTLSGNVRSLQLSVDGDPLLPPVLTMGKGQRLGIEFDELSHDYHRLLYHVEHCNADWTPTDGLFESDYLSGFNDQPIEDYENSFNTTQLYTHYQLSLPNSNTRMRLSGNYRVTVYDDEDPDTPWLQVDFCIVDPSMSIMAELSANTDIDFNQRHHQISYSVSYGSNRVVDPLRELHTVVMQNRRQDTKVVDLPPNIQHSTGVEFTHRRDLIFPAGSEFHKFELLDVNKPGLNVDHIRWYEPFYHVTLYPDRPLRNYAYDEDQNGGFVMRNDDDTGEDATTSEYIWVHFTLNAPRDGGEGESSRALRLYGQWSSVVPAEETRVLWNEDTHQYEAAAYLKQGYYNYQYLWEDGTSPDGDFYEAENEYIILVYHRPQGGRYDRLLGYRMFKNR